MKKKYLILTIIIFLGLFSSLNPDQVWARKKLVRKVGEKPEKHEYGAWVKPKLRSDRHALLLMLGGMQYAIGVDYTLMYNSGPVPQGIQSYHTPDDGSTQKELVFGTCSGNDCIYQGNINEMVLEVKIELKDGRILRKQWEINP